MCLRVNLFVISRKVSFNAIRNSNPVNYLVFRKSSLVSVGKRAKMNLRQTKNSFLVRACESVNQKALSHIFLKNPEPQPCACSRWVTLLQNLKYAIHINRRLKKTKRDSFVTFEEWRQFKIQMWSLWVVLWYLGRRKSGVCKSERK